MGLHWRRFIGFLQCFTLRPRYPPVYHQPGGDWCPVLSNVSVTKLMLLVLTLPTTWFGSLGVGQIPQLGHTLPACPSRVVGTLWVWSWTRSPSGE